MKRRWDIFTQWRKLGDVCCPAYGKSHLRLQKPWVSLSTVRYLCKQQTVCRSKQVSEPRHLVTCCNSQSPSTHGSEKWKSLRAEGFENQSTSLNEYKQSPEKEIIHFVPGKVKYKWHQKLYGSSPSFLKHSVLAFVAESMRELMGEVKYVV